MCLQCFNDILGNALYSAVLNIDIFHLAVFRMQPDTPIFFISVKSLECGFVVYQRNDNISFFCGILLPDYYKVTGFNTCLNHRVSACPQKEKVSLSKQSHRQRNIFLKVFFSVFLQTAGHIAFYRANYILCVLIISEQMF